MPRNGSGVFSPTAGVPVVSGTTISSTAINNVLDDLGDEITASLPVSGVAPMTGVLRVTAGTVGAPGLVPVGDTNTGLYSPGADQLAIATGGVNAVSISATQTTSWAAKATGKAFDVDAITDVASASTCDIGAAATSEVRITGTTTITSFGTSNAGVRRRGRFAGALTLTHNATSLILPGGANITTAANDSFEAVSLGSGNWQVTHYQRASTPPVPGPVTGVLIASGVASSASTVDIPIGSTYKVFVLEIESFYPASNGAALYLRVSDDSGATYENTGYFYTYIFNTSGTATVQGQNSTGAGDTTGFLLIGAQSNSTTLYSGSGRYRIVVPQASLTYTSVHGDAVYTSSGPDLVNWRVVGHAPYTPTHFRLLYSSGNIARCSYRLYGVA